MSENKGYAIYYDSSYCNGCKGCQVSCKIWNDLSSPLEKNSQKWGASYQCPPDLDEQTRLIITFNEADNGKKWGVNWALGRRSCMHCTDAGCVEVCPTGCLSHDEDSGMVVVDVEKCIGCQYCSAACPFDVPRHSNTTLMSNSILVDKCDGCVDRIRQGIPPACVSACQPNALEFGKWEDMVAKAHARVEVLHQKGYKDARVYGEKELGGLHVINVLKYGIDQYELPENPELSSTINGMHWMKPLAGVGAVGVVAGLGLSFLTGVGYKKKDLKYNIEDGEVVDLNTGEVVTEVEPEKENDKVAAETKKGDK